jgi:hypothetical protein
MCAAKAVNTILGKGQTFKCYFLMKYGTGKFSVDIIKR